MRARLARSWISPARPKIGAAGLLVAPPYYSLPREDESSEHFRAVDRAVGIPIMLYNFPGRTGVDMRPELIERLAELKNVRYVKESTGETARMSQIIRRCGDRMTVFCGRDAVSIGSLGSGRGGLGGGHRQRLPGGARGNSTASGTARTSRPRERASTVYSRCSRSWRRAASSRRWSRPAAASSAATAGRRGARCCRQTRRKSRRGRCLKRTVPKQENKVPASKLFQGRQPSRAA